MPAIKIPAKKGPKTIPEIRVTNPGRGLNNLVSDSLIKNEEASDLLNVQFIESGCVSKSYGYDAVGTGLSSNPKGLASFYTSSSRYVLTVDGTSLKYLNSGTWTAISGATFTANQEVNFVQGNDVLYIWNGDQAGSSLTSALSLSRLTTAPSAAFGILYSNYQIVSGVASKPNRVYISTSTDLGDFTNASGELSTSGGVPGATVFSGTGANYIDVNLGDGDKITGFAKFQSVLVVFKERSVWQLTFDSSGVPVIAQISSSTGCTSHKSIDSVENDIFYLSRNGYYVLGNEPNYYNVVRSNELSNRINPLIQTISSSNLNRVAAIFYNFRFYSSIASGGSTTNNRTITYDRRYLSWSNNDHVHANAFTEYIDSAGVSHLYFAADDEAQIYEIETGTYNSDGDAISAYWVSKAYDAGEFDIYKRWVDITLYFRQLVGSVTVTVYADNNQILKTATITSSTSAQGSMGTQMYGEQLYGGTGEASTGESTNNIPYRIKINKKSRTIKVKISNSNVDETFTLLGFNITYVPYNHYSFPSSLKIY